VTHRPVERCPRYDRGMNDHSERLRALRERIASAKEFL
jgi:hypothetical protein